MSDRAMCLVVASILLLFSTSPAIVYSATGDIIFDIVGQGGCLKTGNGHSLNVSGPCPTTTPLITLETSSVVNDSHPTVSDTGEDLFRMPNTVKITANQAVNGLHIIFSREAAAGPTTTTRRVYYKTWAKGKISGGSGTIKLTGIITRVTGSLTQTMATVQTSATTFDASAVAEWNHNNHTTDLTNNRIVKLDLEIVHLDQNAQIDLVTSGGWLSLRSQFTPDNQAPPVNKSDLGFFHLTTFNSVYHYPSNIVDDEAMAAMFVQQNWGSLSQDIARGYGEHLASLAHLMGIPVKDQETFYTEAQQRYAMLSQEGHVTPDIMLVALRSRNAEGIR